MYSWPAIHSADKTTRHRTRGPKKKDAQITAPNYPVLDHGTLGAASLLEDNGRLEWKHIATAPKQPVYLKTGNAVTVFPPTRPPPLQIPKISILQRAEQGANFLRTYFPDIDIASDLLRDQLTEDAKVLRQFEDFDPYVGNQLEAIVRSDSASKQTALLAFPMGELNQDLNISPLLFSENGGASLHPAAQAVRTFDTPIQQISASKPKSSSPSKQQAFLSVRTFGATALFDIKSSGLNATATELASLVSSETGGKPVVDVKISTLPLEMTLVNNEGAVYKYDGSNKTRVVREPQISSSIWRLELTENPDTCLLMSTARLQELDFRTQNSSLDLYNAVSNEVLTSVEDYQADQLLRLCSTNQVLWIDRRNTARPLLGFKHGRAFDRSLKAETIAFENTHLTTLSSRKNGLLTIYDISRSQDGMGSVQAPPYCLTTSGNGRIQTGHTFFRHPLARADSPMALFRLSELGSIRAFQLAFTDAGAIPFQWSVDVQRLGNESGHPREEHNSFGSSEPTTVDMVPAYEHIFHQQGDAEEAAESLYDLVEKAPSFWQELNEPVDRVLTTYDLLFRSGDEPSHPTRADFLAESVINSARGYRAVSQGRVSADSLKKHAPWNHDLTDTLAKFDPDMSPDIRTITERLRRCDLRADEDRSAPSLRRESEAREQLALDLTLARHIYSPHPFSAKGDATELETMTMTLSLNDGPSPVRFGYLRPIASTTASDEDEEKDMIPLGVRLLLKDWDVGTDPRDFAYRDPYGDASEEPAPAPVRRKEPAADALKERPTADAQRPPLVIAATSIHQFDGGRGFLSQDPNLQHRAPQISGSQPLSTNARLEGISQDFMSSTQILPGAYGGRPAIKKKVTKKRLGGF
ncbi:hypothetical protein B0H16DRAFT_1498983 [Mycena metata]|uniref:RRN6 K-rich C-terminal domain-containing protein n=1 Tax=Mycena metata TaxID=1033252 RepID=A0AAD7NZ24_9AGAR|nr:hypothetical protein B0H16DRAFT_1498983 [Mycena metata]